MRKNTFLFTVLTLFFSVALFAQQTFFWKKEQQKSIYDYEVKNYPATAEVFTLNINAFKNKLSSKKGVVMNFPDTDGKLVAYAIEEASIMHPDLAVRYPNNKSYKGVALGDASKTIRFSVNNLGVYAAIHTTGVGTVYIDPISKNTQKYAVFNRKDVKRASAFGCLVEAHSQQILSAKSKVKASNDLKLRTYELALATTGEYSQFHINNAGVASGTEVQKKQAIMNAVVAVMTRVNAIFEREIAVTMTLVANTDALFFLDADSDPYTNDDGSKMLDENQATINNIIGVNNYDLGHVFSTGGGGIALLASPCGGSKAGGVTGQPNPIGDPFSVDYVAHEMGHQFGANHTFNGTAGSCAGNRNDATAVEPGSGSTIMSYAGICTPENVQPLVNDYFNTVSIQEMRAFVTSSDSNCDDETTLVNNLHVPVVNAGADYVVPKSTPLVLKGQASDADGNSLTYCWEQIDNGIVNITSPPNTAQTRGALFRSLSPTSSPNRYLPALNTVLSGNLASTWQVLPSVGRTMNFALTVRDNAAGGGQVAIDEMKVTVDGNSGPFVITSQNANEVFWAAGTQETVLWDVANTNVAPVNCQNVNIVMSLDGGLTYPVTLASNVPNDGRQEITVPNNLTTKARIKVESVNNMFYTVNKTNISITNTFAISIVNNAKQICKPNSVVFDVDLNFAASFNETVSFSVNNLPNGGSVSFNNSSVNSSGKVQMIINNLENVAVGNYTIEVVGTANSITRMSQVQLEVFEPIENQVVLNVPASLSNNVLAKNATFSWSLDQNAQSYEVQIATNASFDPIVESATVTTNTFVSSNLNNETTYYWRVKPSNLCSTGEFSKVSVFTTSKIVCNTSSSSVSSVTIPDNSTTGVNSSINITDDFIINDVNVSIKINHSWMRDLVITLKSPLGKEVKLLDRKCRGNSGNKNMDATFDDDGVVLECANSSPVITGVVIPAEQLSQLIGESSRGNWILNVTDNAQDDTGSLESWSIEICESKAVATTEINAFEGLNLWPNPTTSDLKISFVSLNANPTIIRIYDTLGRLILKKHYKKESVVFTEKISVNALSGGMYFVQITKGEDSIVKRLLIR